MAASRRGLALLALSFLGFVSIGLPDGLLGVAWPSMRREFGLPLEALGALLVATTSAYVAASFSAGWLLARVGLGTLLAASCFATAVSLVGYAIAPSWWIVVGFGVFAGLGAGAIDAGLNTHVARAHGARTLAWLHACYGAGAASGPLLMSRIVDSGLPWQLGYALGGCAQIILAAAFAATRRAWPSASATQEAPALPSAPLGSTLRLPLAWLGMAAFFVYTGLEAAAGAWSYSLLTEARGVSCPMAGAWVSLFWWGLMAGRVLVGFFADRISAQVILRASIVGIGIGAVLLTFGGAGGTSGLGLALIGVAAGPVFPSLIGTTALRLGDAHAANGVGFQIAAAAIGQSLLPALLGRAAGASSLEVVGPALLGAAAALFVVNERLRAAANREPAATPVGAAAGIVAREP